MILPDKHIWLSRSLLNTGAVLLRTMKSGQTVTEIWDSVKARREIKTFDWFVSGMDLLFLLGVVRFDNGVIVKTGEHAHRQIAADDSGRHGKTGATAQ